MKNFLEVIAKIVSKVFLRIFLIILLFFIISVISEFNKKVLGFAEVVESLNCINETVKVEESLNCPTGNFLSNQFIYNKENIKNQDKENFVTASIEHANQYPVGWLEEFNKNIIELQKMFPKDMYWNHKNGEPTNPGENNNVYSITNTPCNHSLNGEIYCNAYYGKSDEVYPYKSTSVQCRGFASLLSDIIFGEDASVKVFDNYDELRIGDQARIDGDYHSVFIIDKTDDYVIVAECNEDLESCKINWGRKIMRDDMERLVCY